MHGFEAAESKIGCQATREGGCGGKLTAVCDIIKADHILGEGYALHISASFAVEHRIAELSDRL
jgi:hypothetical protein